MYRRRGYVQTTRFLLGHRRSPLKHQRGDRYLALCRHVGGEDAVPLSGHDLCVALTAERRRAGHCDCAQQQAERRRGAHVSAQNGSSMARGGE